MFMYPVTLTPDEADGGFVVTFDDIPEAITQGDTEGEALAAAKDALESALDFYFEDKRAVPAPSKAKRGQNVIELPASLSAKVLLPWSMWAMMQKLRMFFMAAIRAQN